MKDIYIYIYAYFMAYIYAYFMALIHEILKNKEQILERQYLDNR